MKTLTDVFSGDLKGWHGLADGTQPAEVVSALEPVRAVRGPFESNRTYHRCFLSEVDRTSPPCQVQIWESWGHGGVFLVEFDDPQINDLGGTLAALGAPELVLKDKRVAIGLVVEERVYATRGVTLSVGRASGNIADGPVQCTHVQLYRSSSTQYYMTDIGTGESGQPYPL